MSDTSTIAGLTKNIKKIDAGAIKKYKTLAQLIKETFTGRDLHKVRESAATNYFNFISKKADAPILYNHYKKEICRYSDPVEITNWVQDQVAKGELNKSEIPQQIQWELVNDAIETIALLMLEKHKEQIAGNNKLIVDQLTGASIKGFDRGTPG